MQNVDVPNPDVSGLEDKHTPSPSSASISWPQCLSFAIPVPGEAADSSCLLRAASGLPALPEHRGAQERQRQLWFGDKERGRCLGTAKGTGPSGVAPLSRVIGTFSLLPMPDTTEEIWREVSSRVTEDKHWRIPEPVPREPLPTAV